MALTDTTPEAERVLAEIYRTMPPGEKWLLAGEAYARVRMLHAHGVRLRNPAATPRQVIEDWIHRVLGFPHVPVTADPPTEIYPMNLGIARDVVRVFVRLGIPYALGGSLASSIHGAARQTQDSDITAVPFPDKIPAFVGSFGDDYYLSARAVEDAHRHRSSFNIIQTSTGLKADVFIPPDGGFEQVALSRRCAHTLPDNPQEPIDVLTPEDIILFKLRWYRLGNEVLDQQWQDIKGVLRAQAGKLDDAHLDRWAQQLGVVDLLARARQESNP
jgi:hypothetical protein